ncbi:MAG: glutamine--fructose-6-phosphate transaminase (isomerizing) [Gracilimonas sp.]|uniref:glutamine--fructose-6-phosphate transaminase (isomerizing) n=1 Tax=Gracilimonas sp. TaxID=1974203 RepID=UPI0019B79267|nr:glutamine--fructose-6-phosphate transaminase (isomerizing) [Gracilimonas sp.]MBD3615455.1 glutamine--fructose-6-phosphate transaminase (isomerizing) [Gracilimonas sp.]
MCGIVGYVGKREAKDILLNGLKRLEYRGYDSAGIALVNGRLDIEKGQGKVDALKAKIAGRVMQGNVGIGHTRWATHGAPNDINSHPHVSQSGKIALVHNGIIENYNYLKRELQNKGREFNTETDTEVIAQLIEEIYQNGKGEISFKKAVQLSLKQIEGSYGIAVVNTEEQNQLIVARKGSPLLIGIGDGEMFVASDASPIVEYTKKVVYLNDGEMAIISENGYQVSTIDDVELTKEVHELALNIEEIQKGGYPHFMLKEIFEQPNAIEDCLRGRLDTEKQRVQLGGLVDEMDRILQAKRFIITACGTSWHAGLVGEYLLEHLTKVPVEVEYASEFRYREQLINEDDVVIAISQSGETADTLAALRLAKEKGALTLGVCNVVGSTIARETDAGVYNHAGPEIGVASTKAFTTQVAVLAMMSILIGQKKKSIDSVYAGKLIEGLASVPDKIQQILEQSEEIHEIAQLFTYAPNFLYLGRSYNFPVALEGALKLKEISYIHAEGYPAAEMKHGPIALIDEMMPVVVIAHTEHTNEKMISNIEEVKARKGRIISVTGRSNKDVIKLSEFCCAIPDIDDCLSSILTVIPLQLLSYYIAINRGCDVDQPRNLAKSVTVE